MGLLSDTKTTVSNRDKVLNDVSAIRGWGLFGRRPWSGWSCALARSWRARAFRRARMRTASEGTSYPSPAGRPGARLALGERSRRSSAGKGLTCDGLGSRCRLARSGDGSQRLRSDRSARSAQKPKWSKNSASRWFRYRPMFWEGTVSQLLYAWLLFISGWWSHLRWLRLLRGCPFDVRSGSFRRETKNVHPYIWFHHTISKNHRTLTCSEGSWKVDSKEIPRVDSRYRLQGRCPLLLRLIDRSWSTEVCQWKVLSLGGY
jgi:hypothetical protein